MTNIPNLLNLEDTIDFAEQARIISKINLVTKACNVYERIRYGNASRLSFDASVDEVLKQMGLEE